MHHSQLKEDDPVVVVGLSFRFPQDATSEEAFWKIIYEGSSTSTEVPLSRYNINGHYAVNAAAHNTVRPSMLCFFFFCC